MQRDGAQFFNGLGQARPLVIGQLAGAQMPLVDAANRTHHAHRQLRRPHFHRENGHRQALIERHMLGNVHREGGVVRHHIVVGDVQALRVADGNALAGRLAHRLNGADGQAPLARPLLGRARLLVGQQKQRLRLWVGNVANIGRQARHPLPGHVGVVRLLLRDGAPRPQRARQRGHTLRQLGAGGAKAHAAPALHPAIGIEQPAQQVQARCAVGLQVQRWDELLVAGQARQAQALQRHAQRVGLHAHPTFHTRAVAAHHAVVVGLVMYHLQIVIQTLLQALQHFGRGSGKLHRASAAQAAIAQQTAQHPGVDGQGVMVAKIARSRLYPEAVLVALALQQRHQLRSAEHARLRPVAAQHTPQMLGATFSGSAIRKPHPKHLPYPLRKDASDDGRASVHRGQGIAHLQIAHALPATPGAYLRIQRLRLAHGRARRQHHHIARLQARGHAIEVDETGGHAGDVVGVVGHLLHAVQQIDHQGVHGLKALLHARAFFTDVEDFLLGLVQYLVHWPPLRVEGVGGDLVAGRHQFAQDGALAHDFGIAADVAGAGHVLRQRVQVGQATYFLGLAQALQLLVHGDHVGGLAGVDQLGNGRKNQLVLVAVKVVLDQQIAYAVPGVVVQQQATEHARLGLDGMRRHAQLRDFAVIGRGKVALGGHESIRHGVPWGWPGMLVLRRPPVIGQPCGQAVEMQWQKQKTARRRLLDGAGRDQAVSPYTETVNSTTTSVCNATLTVLSPMVLMWPLGRRICDLATL